ncbi:MAG: hypothetical protein MI892_12405 [Desulfobacterales bacterium]|nr:hypothetical protein [Desulfobacterales bacterium]
MSIDVQIGTQELKKEIAKELKGFFSDDFMDEVGLDRILVPLDIGSAIRDLTNDEFEAERLDLNQEVLARIIRHDVKKTLILSSRFYTEEFDNLTRSVYFQHEQVHLYNDRPPQKEFNIKGLLINDSNWLYDEYLAYFLSWKSLFDALKIEVDSLEQLYSFMLEEHGKDIKNIDHYLSIVTDLRASIKSGEIPFDEGFAQIKQLINDYLLKIVIVAALLLSKQKTFDDIAQEYTFPDEVVSLLIEFQAREENWPNWIEDHRPLENVYSCFGVIFVSVGTEDEGISLV